MTSKEHVDTPQASTFRVYLAKPPGELFAGTSLTDESVRNLLLNAIIKFPNNGKPVLDNPAVRVWQWQEGRIFYALSGEKLIILDVDSRGPESAQPKESSLGAVRALTKVLSNIIAAVT